MANHGCLTYRPRRLWLWTPFRVPRPGSAGPCDDAHLGPSRRNEPSLFVGDGGILQTPEFIRVNEISLLAEQIGDDVALIQRLVEERGFGRNLRAAE